MWASRPGPTGLCSELACCCACRETCKHPISPGGLCQVGYVPFWFLSSYTRNAWGIWVMRKCYLAGPPGAKGSPRSCGDPVPGQDSAQVAG